MEIKPIKNDADYQAALEEIEQLFDAAPDTPEGDRLEVLTTGKARNSGWENSSNIQK